MPRAIVRLLFVAALAALPASSDSFTIRIGTPPPPARVEVMTVAPSPGHFWVGGYWRWDGHKHVWTAGHWVKARPGQVWVREHWAHRGNEWFFTAGHWVKAA